ncbi:MAG: hypothetical protein GPJ54_11660 [Candidatus Heimdallarchaeota archaeon]|nr:hypothetical protein [Candidatus Heimdallarchaeota archaeon]
MRKHRTKQRSFGHFQGIRRAPVLGGHWRLRQLRQFNFGYQYVENDKFLRLVVPLPGLDKDSLKVRAKPDIVTISATVKEDLKQYSVRPEDSWDILLDYDIIPATSKANYTDGVLIVDFELAAPPEKVDINYS